MLTGPRDRNKPRLRVSFRYEPPGRRLSKTVQRQVHGKAAGRTTTTYFIWDGLRLVQEIHDDVPLTCIYSDVQSYEPLACVDGKENPEIFWFHTAANGMPERLTDSEGRTSWEGISTPWGKLLSESNQGVPGYDQNLRLQGQYLDRETGLHYNLFRYYNPDSARFTQQDPVGLAGGINLYQYAPNPLGWIDPWGLAKCPNLTHGRNGEILSARTSVTPAELKTGTGVNASARDAARAMGRQTDDAGHILAKVLGGQGGKGNVFPQLPNINRGQYRSFEDSVRKFVNKNGFVDI